MRHVTVVDDDKDPVIGDYEVFITDSDVQRYLFQYPDRSKAQPYHEANHQQPTELRIKPKNGLVEVDIPINTAANYNVKKGVQFGEALRKSRITKAGGSHGLAGGFNSGPAGRARYEDEDEDKIDLGAVRHYDGHMDIDDDDERKKGVELARHTLGGRIVAPSDHDPVYMLGAFRGNELHLSPLTSLVQLRPQLHHIDASNELSKHASSFRSKRDTNTTTTDTAPKPPETRAVDMKVKSADGEEVNVGRNGFLLSAMQEEKWEEYEWVDEDDPASWSTYETHMFNASTTHAPALKSSMSNAEYLEALSAPREDHTGTRKGKPRRPRQTIRKKPETKHSGEVVIESSSEDDEAAAAAAVEENDEVVMVEESADVAVMPPPLADEGKAGPSTMPPPPPKPQRNARGRPRKTSNVVVVEERAEDE